VASFGQNLRQAREARNITLQEIAATTKIGTRALEALESDRFDQLPGGIFNKGFVRAYARCVGLDEEKTLAAYLEAAKTTLPETDMQALANQVSAGRVVTHEPWWALNAATFAGILAAIVALALGTLWLKEHRRESRELAAQNRTESAAASASAPVFIPPPAAVVASDPNAAAIGVGNSTTNGTTNLAPEAASTLASNSASPASNAAPNSNQNPPQSTNQSTNQVGTAAANAPLKEVASKEPASPVEISISATARAWISVRTDGKPAETVMLDPEKPEMRTRSYTAKEKLTLIAGNPAGLTVTYNGKPTGTLGTEGHRATITFTPEGMQKR
jgi:cytoskeleton protein RodZ